MGVFTELSVVLIKVGALLVSSVNCDASSEYKIDVQRDHATRTCARWVLKFPHGKRCVEQFLCSR